MATKKYPIGTKVVFMANADMCYDARQDDGKIGKIIGEGALGSAIVFLPDSVKTYGRKCTWFVRWENVKPILVKNQQLLFSFMDND